MPGCDVDTFARNIREKLLHRFWKGEGRRNNHGSQKISLISETQEDIWRGKKQTRSIYKFQSSELWHQTEDGNSSIELNDGTQSRKWYEMAAKRLASYLQVKISSKTAMATLSQQGLLYSADWLNIVTTWTTNLRGGYRWNWSRCWGCLVIVPWGEIPRRIEPVEGKTDWQW